MSRRARVASKLREEGTHLEDEASRGGRGVLDPETLRAAAKQKRRDAKRVETPKRGRGRPRLDPSGETAALTVRLSEAHLAEIAALQAEIALERGREASAAEVVRVLLERSADRRR